MLLFCTLVGTLFAACSSQSIPKRHEDGLHHYDLSNGWLYGGGLLDVVNGTNCTNGATDLVFVLDESGSIGVDNFRTALQALANMTRSFTIGPSDAESHIALVTFNSNASIHFYLNAYVTNDAVYYWIMNTVYGGGGTDIALGMRTAIQQVFVPPGDRPNVPNVMIVITDGEDSSNVAAAHQMAVAKNIVTYALAVGSSSGFNSRQNVNLNQLAAATGDPNKVFNINNFGQMGQMMNQICDAIVNNTARTCHELYLSGNRVSGVYTIRIGDSNVRVYCLMVSQDNDDYWQSGGYTVIQSRLDSTVDFNRSFAEYEQGFGTPTDSIGSYWIGLRNIFLLTSRYAMRLNIRAVLCNGAVQYFGDYGSFRISDVTQRYTATVGDFSTNGLLCDGFNRPQNGGIDNGCPFSTIETYDPNYGSCIGRTANACAPSISYGGWWFGSCANNFNGQFYDVCVDGNTTCVNPVTCDLPQDGPRNQIRWCTGGGATYKGSVLSLLPTS